MRITVAICSRNRAMQLRQSLEQMTRLVIPPDVQWELLVVNNNSTDATDAVLAAFTARLPLRRLFEPTPGKSHALNLAVREASGDYILWTDDDVLVDPSWMTAFCSAFADRPEAAVFGGAIEPHFVGTPPAWLLRVFSRVENVYARREVGDVAAPITPAALPYGANLAIRKREQALHLYDTRLGPQPKSGILYEETVCVLSILASGASGWWVPQAKVRHCISPDRQTLKYVRHYFSGQGEYAGLTMPDRTSTMLLGKPRWLWRRALQAELRFLVRRAFCRPEIWIGDLIIASKYWGQLRSYDHPPIALAIPPDVHPRECQSSHNLMVDTQ